MRKDGYHEIRTIFQAIELHDIVTVRESNAFKLTCTVPGLSGESNLAWKAIRLLSEMVDIPRVEITIEKNIPMEAGLGGGSSDAAAALHALNRWPQVQIENNVLMDIARACGSDVPFFLLRTPAAKAQSRGDELLPVPAMRKRKLVLAMPEAGSSTRLAYAALDRMGHNRFLDFPKQEAMHNDFEKAAPQESLLLMQSLREMGAAETQLCGSGSAVFAEFEEPKPIAALLNSAGIWAVATETLETIEAPEWTQ